MEQDNKQINYIVLLEVMVIIAGIIFGVWQPLVKMKSINQKFSQKTNQLQDLKNQEQKLSLLRQDFQSQKALLDKLDIAVPQDPEIAQALMILEGIASRAGVILTNLTPNDTSSSTDKQFLTIVVSFRADYPQLKEFFDLAVKDLRPIQIDNIKILSSQTDEEKGLTASMEVKMPYTGQITNNVSTSIQNSAAEGAPSLAF